MVIGVVVLLKSRVWPAAEVGEGQEGMQQDPEGGGGKTQKEGSEADAEGGEERDSPFHTGKLKGFNQLPTDFGT